MSDCQCQRCICMNCERQIDCDTCEECRSGVDLKGGYTAWCLHYREIKQMKMEVE